MLETVIEMQEREIAKLKKENRKLKRMLNKLTHNSAHRCWYSRCDEWRGVKEFNSYEEGTVWLCKKHREINEGKTGYTVKHNKAN